MTSHAEMAHALMLSELPRPGSGSRPLSGRSVAVVGGGVIGLSVAHELAADGATVEVFRDQPASETVSALAGAVWFPFEAGPIDRVRSWSMATLERFLRLSEQAPEAGIVVREGLVARRSEAIPEWMNWVEGVRELRPSELPTGVARGLLLTVPIINMSGYLRWLERECRELGVRFHDVHIGSLDALGHRDSVVVAGGLTSPLLVDDDEPSYPIRGQIVRLRNPGLARWYLDEENPDGLTYVIPRGDDVICGGTADEMDWENIDAGTEAAILDRVTRLVPELRGAEVLSRGVGARPGRSVVRLEFLEGRPVPTIACYGHGGAGVTTSWGCAAEVADLLARQNQVAIES